MPLPASWIDSLFGRLVVRYGNAFMDQYRGLDPEAVKLDWADVLDGTRGASITYALQYLPERPPNAMQFRNACRSAPKDDPLPALSAPDADPERVREIVSTLAAPVVDNRSPARRVADRLRELRDGGMKLNAAQRDMLKAVEVMP